MLSVPSPPTPSSLSLCVCALRVCMLSSPSPKYVCKQEPIRTYVNETCRLHWILSEVLSISLETSRDRDVRPRSHRCEHVSHSFSPSTSTEMPSKAAWRTGFYEERERLAMYAGSCNVQEDVLKAKEREGAASATATAAAMEAMIRSEQR